MSKTNTKLIGVQYMRALASMMVLVGHVIAEAEHYFGVHLPLDIIPWTRGVDIFFVISGFIIMVSSQKYYDIQNGVGVFLRNRFVRVVPLYWFFTTLMLVVLLVMPGATKDTQMDWMQTITSYLFIPYERYDGRAAPILSLGWTLNFEIFFYAVFSLALLLPRRIGPWAVIAAMALWSLLGAVIGFEQTVLRVWANPLIIEFCFGVALGYVYVFHWQGVPGRNGLAFVMLAVGFLLLVLLNVPGDLPRFIASGIPAAVMVGAVVFLWHQSEVHSILSRFGALMGDCSFALYLSHRFVLRALTIVLVPLLPGTAEGAGLFVLLACTVAILGSIVVYHLIERPMLALFSRPRRQIA